MKVALVHDYLNQYGGAERVLEAFIKIFPDADIYTLFYSKKGIRERFHQNITKTSFLDFELARRYHKPFIPLMPLAAHRIKIKGTYDLVISDTAGYAKGVNIEHLGKKNNPFHISYCHTPLRYAWETDNYFSNSVFKTIFRPAFNYLKKWDFKAAQSPDILIANSNFISSKIKEYYKRNSRVIYPPVDSEKFYFEPRLKQENYYLAAGRLLHYKKFDLVAEAFCNLGLSLKIVGRGPEEKKIKSAIKDCKNIELVSFATDDELRGLYNRAKAFILPQIEDFGLVAAEAQFCGSPVIAYSAGGALEIVQDGKTGIFFHRQEPDCLVSAVKDFEKMKFNRKKISEVSKRFSFSYFKKEILELIFAEIYKTPNSEIK